MLCDRGDQAPGAEDARGVGGDLDARADLWRVRNRIAMMVKVDLCWTGAKRAGSWGEQMAVTGEEDVHGGIAQTVLRA